MFIAGIAIRLWYIHTFPGPFIHDQWGYDEYARGIADHGFFAMVSRLYGYPLFLSVIYRIFGSEQTAAWQIVQAMLDTSTAIIAYAIARLVWGSRRAATIAGIAVLVNPLAIEFVGLRLTEPLATFLLTAGAGCLMVAARRRLTGPLVATAFLWSYLSQVRPTFFSWTIAAIPVAAFLFHRYGVIRMTAARVAALGAAVAIPLAYTVAGNLVYYRQLSPGTVDRTLGGMLFLSALYPGAVVDGSPYPEAYDRVAIMNGEYSTTPTNAAERRAMNDRYVSYAMEYISRDPARYASWCLGRAWRIWEKRFLFTYTATPDAVSAAITWTNRIFLAAAAAGIILRFAGLRRHPDRAGWTACVTVLMLVLFLSGIHMLATTEDRYTLPVYPLLSVMAAGAAAAVVKRGKTA